MKKYIINALTLTLIGLVTMKANATTVFTTPLGFTEIQILGDGATSVIGINLIQKETFTGRASAVGAGTVSVEGVDLTERLTTGRSYALLVTTGTNAGANTLVTSWTASQLTLQEDLSEVLAVNAESFQLQELPTVSEIFGTGGQVLSGGTATTADQVRVVNPLSGESLTLFYSTGGITGVGWRASGKGTTNFGNMPVYFLDGLSILKKSSGQGVIELSGSVQKSTVSFPVTTGYQSFANVFAASSTLGNSGLFLSGSPDQSLLGGSATSADQVMFDADGDGAAETYYYSTGGITGVGWRRVGGGATPQTDVLIGSAFDIRKRSGTSEIQRQSPY